MEEKEAKGSEGEKRIKYRLETPEDELKALVRLLIARRKPSA